MTPDNFKQFFQCPDIQASLRASTQQHALFWSGVGDIVTAFQAAENLFVMENSPLVALVSDLMFCGSSTTADGFGTDCVYGDFNPLAKTWQGTWVSYWAAASAKCVRLFVCVCLCVCVCACERRL